MSRIVKPATTYMQQIKLLEQRGLIITDKIKAEEVLARLNYYTFTGYLHNFKIDNENYEKGLTFEKIYNIMQFDKRFRNILMYALETIEHTLKTKIAYNIAHSFGPKAIWMRVILKITENTKFLSKNIMKIRPTIETYRL